MDRHLLKSPNSTNVALRALNVLINETFTKEEVIRFFTFTLNIHLRRRPVRRSS